MTNDSQLIFDAHSHAFPDGVASGAIKSLTDGARWEPVKAHHDGTIRGLLATMDQAGIARTLMCAVATRPSQVRKITDWSAAIASDRIIPFASIHPDFEEPEAEVERIAQLGIRGLKFHSHYMQCAADDPRMLRIIKAAAKANLAAVFHGGHDLAFDRTDLASPKRMRAIKDAAPDLRMLVCHLGGWRCWEESLQYLVGQPIYLETSYSLGDQSPRPLREQILQKHPPQYLLFGTDSPWMNQADELEKFQSLPLSPATQRLVLWENALRFLLLKK